MSVTPAVSPPVLHRQGARLPKGRVQELDGLRGIAILLVLFTHFWPDRGFLSFFYPVATAGWMGVDLFFCLSGFLITGILLDNLDAPHYFRNFYARRTIRIFPLYYVVILATMAISLLAKGGAPYREITAWGSFWWFLLYVANIRCGLAGSYPPNDGLTVMWSLQIEEQFYLAYPALVRWVGKRRLTAFLLGVIAFGLAIRLGTLGVGMNRFVQYTFTLCRVDSLAMGGLVAVLIRNHRWPWSPTVTARLAALLGTIVIAGQLAGGDSGWKAIFNRSVGFTLISGSFALMLAWTVLHLGDRCAAPLRFRPLTYIGQISYGLYMLHLPVFEALKMLLRHFHMASLPVELTFGLNLLAAITAATISWYAFESPLLRLKAHFQSRAGAAAHS